MAYVDEPELKFMVKIIERMLKNIFPGGESPEYGISHYLTRKNGKLYIKDSTLPKFIDKIEKISWQIEENGKIKRKTFTTKLEDFDKSGEVSQPEFTEDDRVSLLFKDVDFN